MPAADYTPANLSHFSSSDYWFAGALKGMSTGWIGRWLDAYGSMTNPLQAISIDSALSKAIRTSRAPVCAISSLSSVGFPLDGRNHAYPPPGGVDLAGIDPVKALAGLSGVGARPGNAHLARARATYGLATDVIADLAALGTPSVAAGYPTGSRLATKLRLAAQLLQANLGTRVITIHWGAFDTHNNELTRQDPQITELARCLSAFRADLTTRGVEQKVATLVFSEFGRRVKENSAAGTDHGAGGLMMLSGSAVRGGLASPPPSVTDLDSRGNVRVQTDFRAVYRGVIAEWLGGDPAAILPGEPTIPALARADGTATLFRP
jgi:uncharacterized protein (DUF1501 family)